MLSIVNVRKDLPIFTGLPETDKTMKTSWYKAVPVYTRDGDDVYMEEDKSTQHEEDSFALAGVKQKQDHEVESKSEFPLLRLACPVITQV